MFGLSRNRDLGQSKSIWLEGPNPRGHAPRSLGAGAGALASLEDSAFVDSVVREVARGREEYRQLAAEPPRTSSGRVGSTARAQTA